jgi:tetratricopeptide (TPR) repeat protein
VLSAHPSDAAWFALAQLYSNEHRYPEALHCVQEAASLSQVPYERLRSSGLIYLYMNQPQNALTAFSRSEQESPYRGKSSNVAREFNAKIAEGRARAYRQLKEMDQAITEQKLATSLTPENPIRWSTLAELYEAQGNTGESLAARQRAKSIQDAAKSQAISPTPR